MKEENDCNKNSMASAQSYQEEIPPDVRSDKQGDYEQHQSLNSNLTLLEFFLMQSMKVWCFLKQERCVNYKKNHAFHSAKYCTIVSLLLMCSAMEGYYTTFMMLRGACLFPRNETSRDMVQKGTTWMGLRKLQLTYHSDLVDGFVVHKIDSAKSIFRLWKKGLSYLDMTNNVRKVLLHNIHLDSTLWI